VTGTASAALVGQKGTWPCQSSASCLCFSATAPCPVSKNNLSILKWDSQYLSCCSYCLQQKHPWILLCTAAMIWQVPVFP
jgi:hypothetical protein